MFAVEEVLVLRSHLDSIFLLCKQSNSILKDNVSALYILLDTPCDINVFEKNSKGVCKRIC